jgi:hypothetical protein
VKQNDIFASFSEAMNWTAVNNALSSPYPSFDSFKDSITSDPGWWLKYSWSIDVKGYGVPINSIQRNIVQGRNLHMVPHYKNTRVHTGGEAAGNAAHRF